MPLYIWEFPQVSLQKDHIPFEKEDYEAGYRIAQYFLERRNTYTAHQLLLSCT